MSCRCHQLMNILTFPDALNRHFRDDSVLCGSLLQCFKVRIRTQIFRPDLGPVRLPPPLQLVVHKAHQHKITNPYISMFIRKDILSSSLLWIKSSETSPWYRQSCFSASTMFPIMFHKLQTCSNNAKSTDFRYNCLVVASHTLHFTLFTTILFRISFKFCF